jgi:hypothetical protein
MSLRHRLNGLFATPGQAAPGEPEAENGGPDIVSDARAQLRAAFAERDEAKQALEEARNATQRVEQLIEHADAIEQEAQQAAAAAADATRRWAEGGARGDMPDGDQALLDAAADAQKRALQARMKSDGARSALPAVRRTEQAAQDRLAQSERDIGDKAMRVVFEEHVEPGLCAIEAAAAACREAVALVVSYAWLTKFAGHRDHEGSAEVRRRLSQCTPVTAALTNLERAAIAPEGLSAGELGKGFKPLMAFAEKLRTNPETTFSAD